ncbi:hypothetical protein A5727_23590 [Mycobacterium sp. ACS4331]|nr:hypothetical protein A5727_23590 [Mycobacterium sp. ACS4331]
MSDLRCIVSACVCEHTQFSGTRQQRECVFIRLGLFVVPVRNIERVLDVEQCCRIPEVASRYMSQFVGHNK